MRILGLIIVVLGLGVGAVLLAANGQQEPESDQTTEREPIVLPISLYLLVSDDDASEEQAALVDTQRSEDELRETLDGMNDIWSQADIQLEAQAIGELAVPVDVLADILSGNFNSFFRQAGITFDIPNAAEINGYYARGIGGPNGIVPFRAPHYFVTDRPSVHDRRVSSHEVGHILGLHHTLGDRGRLLFPGTNGMALTEEEIVVARYFAQGYLDDVR